MPSPSALPGHTAPVVPIAQVDYLPDWCSPNPPGRSERAIRVRLPALLEVNHRRPCPAERWLRLTFSLPIVPTHRYALYMRHVEPDSAFYLNGIRLGATAGFDDPSGRSWNYPVLLTLPVVLLHADGSPNEVLIEARMGDSTLSELGPVWVGDNATLTQRYSRQLWLRVMGIEVVSLLVGLIGLFAALLWMRRRRETIFGLFALSCGLWIIRNSRFFIVREHSPFYFSLLTDATLFWLAAVLYTMCVRILERRIPWAERSVYGYALAATIAMWAAGPQHKPIVTAVAYALLLPGAAVFQFYLTRETWRAPSVLRCLLWFAVIISAITGGRDLLLMMHLLPQRDGYLMPYSALFYALTVGWALVDRFVRSHNQYEQLNRELEQRVQQRERLLASQYARSSQLEREQAIAAEHDRILRDMHDGLGLHLTTALRLLERDGTRSAHLQSQSSLQQQLVPLLRDAMDELRVAIDSMQPSARDLLAMLGNLRYRLEPRLSSAGITLHWNVAELPEPLPLSASQVMEITRMVQELCTNAIKHSQATDMYLTVEPLAGSGVHITLSDNGIGFDVATARRGEGLRSLRRRAASLGATLTMSSQPGRTTTSLTLTLTAATPASGQEQPQAGDAQTRAVSASPAAATRGTASALGSELV